MIDTSNSIKHELFGQDVIRNYVLGGEAVVTLMSSSGVHHTYKFAKTVTGTMVFVYVMVENEVWRSVGTIRNNHFMLSYPEKFPFNSEEARGVYYILKLMYQHGGYYDSRMRLFHSGRCSVCCCRLTSHYSIRYGMGKECRIKVS